MTGTVSAKDRKRPRGYVERDQQRLPERRERKAKPAIEVITGSDAVKPAIAGLAGLANLNLNASPENLPAKAKPA